MSCAVYTARIESDGRLTMDIWMWYIRDHRDATHDMCDGSGKLLRKFKQRIFLMQIV